MRAKDLKETKIYQVELDKVRPFTFDFNTLSELQDLGYDDPYAAVAGMETMNLKAIRSLFYASLLSGQAAEDENIVFDLTISKVGNYLGMLMQQDNPSFQVLFGVLGEAIADFFDRPKPAEKGSEAVEGEEKN